MVAVETCEQAELQSPRPGVMRALRAAWTMLMHQRRYRRILSELSRFDSRLLQDIGLEYQEVVSGKIGERMLRAVNDQKP